MISRMRAFHRGHDRTGTSNYPNVLAWKYGLGVPLHRLRKLWTWQGADIAAGTLIGAFQALVPVLEPLYQAILAFNRTESWWHADETHWKVFVESEGKVRHHWWIVQPVT